MKEKWEILKEAMDDSVCVSKREFCLVTAVCVLGGILLGMLISPKKTLTIGSNNGSNNYTFCDDETEQIDVWEDEESEA